jgi:hypothetical protein
MERHDEKPRAYPEREAGRRDEAAPEEGPAAADAAREYTDTGSERTDPGHDYVDPSGEYSEAGRDESVEAVRTSESRPGQEAASEEYAERKAVSPDAEARQAAAPAAEETGGGLSGAGAQTTRGAVTLVEQTAVLSREDAQTFQVRWETIQGTFIDDPHAATEQADALVGEVMEQLARLREEYLRQLRGALGDGSDTEAMRVALQRYRAFFQMLLG